MTSCGFRDRTPSGPAAERDSLYEKVTETAAAKMKQVDPGKMCPCRVRPPPSDDRIVKAPSNTQRHPEEFGSDDQSMCGWHEMLRDLSVVVCRPLQGFDGQCSIALVALIWNLFMEYSASGDILDQAQLEKSRVDAVNRTTLNLGLHR